MSVRTGILPNVTRFLKLSHRVVSNTPLNLLLIERTFGLSSQKKGCGVLKTMKSK